MKEQILSLVKNVQVEKNNTAAVPFPLENGTELMLRNEMVYISGPVTDIPDLNRREFLKMEEKILGMGFSPVNPHHIIPTEDQLNLEWDRAMRIDVKFLLPAGLVVMLPKWWDSTGAIFEFITAKTLNIPVVDHHMRILSFDEEVYPDLFQKIIRKIQHHEKHFNKDHTCEI